LLRFLDHTQLNTHTHTVELVRKSGQLVTEAAIYTAHNRLTYLLAYLLTYLLTPWSRVLPEKLTGFQLVKKFPAFYGTRMFITAFTSARHLPIS